MIEDYIYGTLFISLVMGFITFLSAATWNSVAVSSVAGLSASLATLLFLVCLYYGTRGGDVE